MEKTLSFIVKDADGVQITDPSGVTMEFLEVSASSNLAEPSKRLDVMADTVVTDGSCGTAAVSGSEIVVTAPDQFPPSFKCKLRGVYNGSALSGQFETLVSLSPTVAESSAFSFTSTKILSDNVASPAMTANNDGVVYVCYNTLNTETGKYNGIYLIKSADAGVTWGSPVALTSESQANSCSVAVYGDTVAVVWNTSAPAYKVAFSSDAGATFGSEITLGAPVDASYTTPRIVLDSNGVAHVVSSNASNKSITACSATSCGTAAQITSDTAVANVDADIAISSDNGIFVVWEDTNGGTVNDVYASYITYSGGSYTIGTATKISDSAAYDANANALTPFLAVDRDGLPVITWPYYVYLFRQYNYSNIFMSRWNHSTGDVTDAVQVSDIDQDLLPQTAEPFVAYDNYIHVLYMANNADGGVDVRYSLEDGAGGFTTSRNLNLTEFTAGQSRLGLVTDLAGRPYIIWEAYRDSPRGGDIYLGVGTITR